MKKTIVVSGINLFEGGTLSVYKDLCQDFVDKKIYDEYNVIMFVHKKELFTEYLKYFEILELPKSREGWLKRIYYEYWYFHKFSKNKDIYLWISIHDMTPRVKCEHLMTYCHNATPFYKADKSIWKLDKKVYLFSHFYKYLYKINIKKNDFIIVQQRWMANAFQEMYHLKKVKVFYPQVKEEEVCQYAQTQDSKYLFFYPTFPRVFKNAEIICEAIQVLNQRSHLNYEAVITLSEEQNPYSAEVIGKYKHVKNVCFIGKIDRQEVFEYYNRATCLVFPSKLETWGIPISEFKAFHKPIIIADLEYAHEAINNYDLVSFFNPDDVNELADKMEALMNGKLQFEVIQDSNYKTDFKSWKEVIKEVEGKEL